MLVCLLVLSFAVGLTYAQSPATPPAAKVTNDVVYGTAGGVKLRLDASVPAGAGPHPAVILVHGGAWQAGDKTNFRALFDPLSRAGYAWFSINYRLAPKATIPEAAKDVEAAVQWVQDNAVQYNIDPKRVALLGESAGGHLVELVAARTPNDSPLRPSAVVALYAPSDLSALADSLQATGMNIQPLLKTLLGRTTMDAATKALLREASPVTHVRAGLPPFLLLHGTADRLVPVAQSIAFKAACEAAGVPCELITVRNGPHGMMFWNAMDPSYKGKILAFLDQQLRVTR